MRPAFLLLVAIFFIAGCHKNINNPTANNKGDVIIGRFLEFSYTSGSPVISASASVTKVSSGKYKFSANNSIPPFNFDYDAFGTTLIGGFNGDFYYSIPKQTTNGISIDTTVYMTLYNSRSLEFTLISKSSNKSWNFSGVKQ